MAQVMAKNLMPNLRFASMGVAAGFGSPASSGAIRAMESMGLCLDGHSSRLIEADVLSAAKTVLAMTKAHKSAVKSFCKDANVYTLAEFAGTGFDIADPFGGDFDTYMECAEEIKAMLVACARKLVNGA